MPSQKKDFNNNVENDIHVTTTIRKAFSPNSEFEKDEYLDVIYWLRQIIGFLFGIVWGIIPLKGLLGILLFCGCNAGLLYLYFTHYQPADDEEIGDAWELTKEGFMSSFSVFLVAWIVTYSGFHFE